MENVLAIRHKIDANGTAWMGSEKAAKVEVACFWLDYEQALSTT